MKLILILAFSIVLSNTIFCANSNFIEIKSYNIVERYALMNEKKVIIIREMIISNETKLILCLEPETLKTFLTNDSKYVVLKEEDFTNTLYSKIKSNFLSSNKTICEIENKKQKTKKCNILLTTDLCPSTSRMDYDFYTNIKESEKVISNSIPFIIFFSGKWIETHKDALEWLKTNNLKFLAGNHTYHHHIIENNIPEEKLISEITNTEILMLKNGIVPSCFFRFPGLKYKKENLETLAKLNLIPLGVNLWIGQKYISEQSILLVHSNGGMKVEVRMFKKFTKNFKTKLKNGKIRFLSPEEWFSLPFRYL